MVEEIKADMKYAEDNGHCADAIRFNRQMNFAREEIDEYWNSIPLERRQAICAAERDGRCVVLPCKVGDTVWKIKAVFSYYSKPMEDRVDRIIISDKEILVCCTSGTKFSTDSIGKTVFLTRAEAEAALKGASNGD